MNKLIDFLWFAFVFIEIFALIITFYYLRREYVKALSEYRSNKAKANKYHFVAKDIIDKRKVKVNMTQCLDIEGINNELNNITLLFDNGRTITIPKNIGLKIRIGRDPRNDIKIDDISVSRRQCILVIGDDGFVIRNFSDVNVTRVNGEKIKHSKKIISGDIVKIGNQEFKFMDAS